MATHDLDRHLDPERIQALLDGLLPAGAEARVREHVGQCARCRSEVESWELLYLELGELPELTPGPGFTEAVLERLPSRPPLGERIRRWVGLDAERPAREPAHVGSRRLQDFLDGTLPAAAAARLRAHVGKCPACAGELASWRELLGSLDRLERLAPSPGFAARVMEGVRVPMPAPAPAPVPALGTILGERVRAWAGRLVPTTRRAWAATAAVAAAPTIAVAAVAWLVFSHPLLTPGYLASFAWWQVSGAAVAAGRWVVEQALPSAALFRAYSLVEALSSAGAGALLLGALGFSMLSLAALWVLYRNLISGPSPDGYAHASI